MNSNPSRGARFNAAYTYVNYCNERNIQCFCAVISEDETIDVSDPYLKADILGSYNLEGNDYLR